MSVGNKFNSYLSSMNLRYQRVAVATRNERSLGPIILERLSPRQLDHNVMPFPNPSLCAEIASPCIFDDRFVEGEPVSRWTSSRFCRAL